MAEQAACRDIIGVSLTVVGELSSGIVTGPDVDVPAVGSAIIGAPADGIVPMLLPEMIARLLRNCCDRVDQLVCSVLQAAGSFC